MFLLKTYSKLPTSIFLLPPPQKKKTFQRFPINHPQNPSVYSDIAVDRPINSEAGGWGRKAALAGLGGRCRPNGRVGGAQGSGNLEQLWVIRIGGSVFFFCFCVCFFVCLFFFLFSWVLGLFFSCLVYYFFVFAFVLEFSFLFLRFSRHSS